MAPRRRRDADFEPLTHGKGYRFAVVKMNGVLRDHFPNRIAFGDARIEQRVRKDDIARCGWSLEL